MSVEFRSGFVLQCSSELLYLNGFGDVPHPPDKQALKPNQRYCD